MKTEKYFIECGAIGIYTDCIKISKKEYEKRLLFLKSQLTSDDVEFPVTERVVSRVKDTYDVYTTEFQEGTTWIQLTKLVCKPGYCFK